MALIIMCHYLLLVWIVFSDRYLHIPSKRCKGTTRNKSCFASLWPCWCYIIITILLWDITNNYPLYIQRRIYMNCVSSVGLCNNNRSTICYIFMEIYSINSRLLPCTMFICEEYLLRCWGLGIHLMWIYCIVIRHPSSNLCLWELKRGIILYQLLHVKQHYHVWHPTGMNNYQIENYLLAIICQFLC